MRPNIGLSTKLALPRCSVQVHKNLDIMFELITTFKLITTTEWLRLGLLYSHLGLCIFAISSILKTDIALFFGHVTHDELAATAKSVSVLLLLLWATGLTIIYIDTGFLPSILMTNSKLLLKLMCVCMLTLNGILLHHISFPVLTNNSGRITAGESVLLVVTGALSTSHWLLAAFVGMSRPLGRLPFATLFSAYGLFVLTVVVSSLFFIPTLSRVKPVASSNPA